MAAAEKEVKMEIPFTDYRETEDYKFWKDLNLSLCPKCGSKPRTNDTNDPICPNGLGECDGVKLWKSKK